MRFAERNKPLILPGAADALTARLIEELGFEAVYVTDAGVANRHLGVADLGLITLSELADHVEAIRDAVEIPIFVDADTGFGGPLNVRRTVQALERGGANAIQLEDQVFPKRCGHFAGKHVVPATEMVAKLSAALDARADDSLLVIAAWTPASCTASRRRWSAPRCTAPRRALHGAEAEPALPREAGHGAVRVDVPLVGHRQAGGLVTRRPRSSCA